MLQATMRDGACSIQSARRLLQRWCSSRLGRELRAVRWTVVCQVRLEQCLRDVKGGGGRTGHSRALRYRWCGLRFAAVGRGSTAGGARNEGLSTGGAFNERRSPDRSLGRAQQQQCTTGCSMHCSCSTYVICMHALLPALSTRGLNT
jgi:hypothetical protein